MNNNPSQSTRPLSAVPSNPFRIGVSPIPRPNPIANGGRIVNGWANGGITVTKFDHGPTPIAASFASNGPSFNDIVRQSNGAVSPSAGSTSSNDRPTQRRRHDGYAVEADDALKIGFMPAATSADALFDGANQPQAPYESLDASMGSTPASLLFEDGGAAAGYPASVAGNGAVFAPQAMQASNGGMMFEFKRANSNGAGRDAGLLVNSGSVLDNPLQNGAARANGFLQGKASPTLSYLIQSRSSSERMFAFQMQRAPSVSEKPHIPGC